MSPVSASSTIVKQVVIVSVPASSTHRTTTARTRRRRRLWRRFHTSVAHRAGPDGGLGSTRNRSRHCIAQSSTRQAIGAYQYELRNRCDCSWCEVERQERVDEREHRGGPEAEAQVAQHEVGDAGGQRRSRPGSTRSSGGRSP